VFNNVGVAKLKLCVCRTCVLDVCMCECVWAYVLVTKVLDAFGWKVMTHTHTHTHNEF